MGLAGPALALVLSAGAFLVLPVLLAWLTMGWWEK
jgi:hypothetical protein